MTGVSHLLRLQADAHLAQLLRGPSAPGEGGALEIPTRERVGRGDELQIEVSFGAMADEVTLCGHVEAVTPRGGTQAPLVLVRFVPEHGDRVRYVEEVLADHRRASARASRRLSSEVLATWRSGFRAHSTQIGDISRGGAFIRSAAPPSIGSEIDLELDDTASGPRDAKISLSATVAWTGRSQGQRGFGVKFRIADRATAQRIAALVRRHE